MVLNRITRINELVCREFNVILHTVYRDVMLDVTVTGVQVSPDLRDAYVFLSVIGDEIHEKSMLGLLKKHSADIRKRLFSKIQIKYSPRINLRIDHSIRRGHSVLKILDSV